jgi:hypothetical protein
MCRNLFRLAILAFSFFLGAQHAFCRSTLIYNDDWIYQDNIISPWTVRNATYTAQSTEQVYNGTYSFKVIVPQWGGAVFASGSGNNVAYLDPNGYSAVELYIYVAGGDGQLYVELSNDSSSAVGYWPNGSTNATRVTANQWTRINVSMNSFRTLPRDGSVSLDSSGHLFNALNLGEGASGGRTWYLDNIRFIGTNGVSAPSAPTLTSPANGATNVATSTLLLWHRSAGATSYRLQVSADSTFATSTVDQSGITDTTYGVTLASGTMCYWHVNATGPGGTSAYSSSWHFTTVDGSSAVERLNGVLPKALALKQNFPNPFNSSTRIRFDLPRACLVSLKVYNVLGQEVATLVDEIREAGYESVEFNAARLASGVYYYRLNTSSFVDTKMLLLLK